MVTGVRSVTMADQQEPVGSWAVSWFVALLVAVVVLGPIAFLVGTGLLSIGVDISNRTGLPLGFSWALVLIYLGVAVTTILRVRAARARRAPPR
jgi:hypothetical protein